MGSEVVCHVLEVSALIQDQISLFGNVLSFLCHFSLVLVCDGALFVVELLLILELHRLFSLLKLLFVLRS